MLGALGKKSNVSRALHFLGEARNLGVNQKFLIPPSPMAAFKITTLRLNINYKLFGLLAQTYY